MENKQLEESTVTALIEMGCDSMTKDGICAFTDASRSICKGKCCLKCSLDIMEKCAHTCNDLKAIAMVIGNIAPHLSIWQFHQV